MSSKLGFSEWPFHTLPDENFVKIWCGRESLQKRLDKVFTRLIEKPGFQICLIYGDFGAGKTHGIRHMLNKYRESANLLTAELEYDITIRTFTQVYESLINRMDFAPINNWSEPPSALKVRDFGAFYRNLKSDDETKQALAIQWLAGQEKSKRALGEIGIKNAITDTDTAVRAFSELTKLAGKNHSAVVLFIDEFQHVGKLNANWRDNILNGLTKLVNESPNHLCLIISFRLKMPVNILSIIPENMVQRFSGEPFIEFKNFSREEAAEFMKCLFQKFRSAKTQDDYFPYTRGSFEEVLSYLAAHHVEYNPRSLMKIFDHISQSFENAEGNPPISEESIKESLETYQP
jgi:Cdc6-like AAA superfamily ATPase